MPNQNELEELIRTHFTQLPLSTKQDSLKIEDQPESGRLSVMYTYDGTGWCMKKGYVFFEVDDNGLYVKNIEVNSSFRKQDNGRNIVLALESIARKLGFKEVIVDGSYNNPFWSKMGYEAMSLPSNCLVGYHKSL